MKRIFAALILAAFLAAQGGADATVEYPGNLHWGTANRPLRLIDSVKPRWQTALDTAATAWSTGLLNLDLVVVNSSTKRKVRKKCRPSTGAVHVCNFKYGTNKGWAGLAEFSYNPATGHFVSARIRLNDSTTAGAGANILLVVACHEIGHVLGLDHDPNDATSCMTPRANNGAPAPSLTDLATVDANHGHAGPDSVQGAGAADVARTTRQNPDGTVTVRYAVSAPNLN
jgi:predicted Zn-dependent protease